MINEKRMPVFTMCDCVELYVPDLDAGIAYYSGALGLKLLWRADTSAGLGMAEGETEVTLQTDRQQMNVDFKVPCVADALERIVSAGGKVVCPAFDIPIGKCAVVADPFGNRYVLLDMSKGRYATDAHGNVTGVTGA